MKAKIDRHGSLFYSFSIFISAFAELSQSKAMNFKALTRRPSGRPAFTPKVIPPSWLHPFLPSFLPSFLPTTYN